ncbi:MAG: sugar phosphate nucleotidyltransferase [Acholeplasma sp.]|nr:sugar phosphate nucleotidyltransferase [Acholeplasma sp.]
MKILILAGGSGVRFWPLSTKAKPKQLLNLVSEKSMIRETVERILRLVSYDDIFIATNKVQVEKIKSEIPELRSENIIIEPAFRDTAAAIAYGSTYISKYETNPTVVVLAADHLIQNTDAFLKSIKISVEEALKGNIITLGIKPTKPETGYGYIKIDSAVLNTPTRAQKFMEKPNYETALNYIRDGNYMWNSGIFIFKYNTIMDELEKYVPNHISILNQMRNLIFNYQGIQLSEKVMNLFINFDRISIDYAVMEKSTLIKCIPVDIGWNDIGGYNSLADLFAKDNYNNVVKNARYVYLDSNENIIISEDKNRLITSIGVTNMIIVDSINGILICNRNDSQRIKELINLI